MLVFSGAVLACDHAGYALRPMVEDTLRAQDCPLLDLGTDSQDRVDYPDYARSLARTLEARPEWMGILICGSGIGMSIAANRFGHVRAALCHSCAVARLAREHNNANVLVLGGRVTDPAAARDCVLTFLHTAFDIDSRHRRRLDKIGMITQKQ